MQDFARPKSRFAALPPVAKLVYSIFLVFTLGGLALSVVLTHDMVGLDLQGLDAYYAGAPDAPPPTTPTADTGGPTVVLPPEAANVGQHGAMPRRKLLEVTHFHLFSMPVYLLILSHIFMLCAITRRTKMLWIAIGTAGTALHIAAPWVATHGGTAAAIGYGVSGLALLTSYLVMCAVPLLELWRSRV